MPPTPLLLLHDIRVTFGGTPLLEGAALAVCAGERLALVGRNGAGKSSLLKIAAGLIEPDSGSRFLQPGATVRYLPQEPDMAGFPTALAYVEAGLVPGDDPYRARYLLGQLGLNGGEDPSQLSGGEARRCALVRALASEPDILLLDEPTNHLDLPTITWLENELAALRSALVLISHDRRFLQSLSRAMVWLDRGTTRRLERGFVDFEQWRDEVLELEERDSHKLGRRIAREEDWLRYGVTARRKRNVRRLAELQALRQRKREWVSAPGRVKMTTANAGASGSLVIAADRVSKSYEGRPIVRDFSTRVLRRERVGIVGPNGAGKTTLLSLLTGALPPDAGTVVLGTGLAIATLDQGRASLEANQTLAEALTSGHGDTVFVNGTPKHVLGYMKDFLFTPEQARTPVHALSGGERGRLLLARALAKESNLLVLDEPTNDLDLETLDLMQEQLAEYPGTVLVVSHDRDFLDRVATSVLLWEGDGRWREYAGGYSDMLAQRGPGIAEKSVALPVKPERNRPARGNSAATAERRRMTFKQKYALQTLPARIDSLHGKQAALREALSDPSLYTRDRAAFERYSAALAATDADLAVAEDEWLALEMLREELAGS